MPQRKLASVLPEPVGAQISALAPLEIASQPPVWAGVGPSKEASNQRRTGAENGANGSDFVLRFFAVVNPPILRRCPRRPSRSCSLSRNSVDKEQLDAAVRGGYGVPPANLANSVQEGFGMKPSLNRP